MSKIHLKRVGLSVICFLISPLTWAQSGVDSSTATIDDTMRSHDKIYVVMAVCVLILAVFFLYLVRIDRKVSKKERAL